MNTRERDKLKTPVGLSTGNQTRIPSTNRTSTTSSAVSEKTRAMAPKRCRKCGWRDMKISTKWLRNNLYGLAFHKR